MSCCAASSSCRCPAFLHRGSGSGSLWRPFRRQTFFARPDLRNAYFARLGFAFPPDVLRATAARMSALNAPASTFSPSWMSIARLVFPSRLELNSLAGSFNEAPLAKVNFTIDL